MPTRSGMLNQSLLLELAVNKDIDTILVIFTDCYGRFMGKRLDVDFFCEHAISNGVLACNYLLTAGMKMEVVEGYQFANWGKGYGDILLKPDLSTLRIASWLEKTALVICDVLNPETEKPVNIAPRNILKTVLEKFLKHNYSIMAASELEYHIFQNTYKESAKNNYAKLEPAGWYVEDYHILQGTREEQLNGAARRHLKASGIKVENTKGEAGIGQHELNMRYTDVLTMSDQHVVFKQCLKELAEQLEVSVTFMAKHANDAAGSSSHLHISLFKEDKNIFSGKKSIGPINCSQEFLWFLGGWMYHLPEIMVFFAPTINSYKRYQDASWAPTRIAWSFDNRSAGFRIVGNDQSLRIECRIPGADVNPYLAFSAALAAGLDGIKNKIDPPKMFEGDAYSDKRLSHVPKSLQEAVQLFSKSKFARKAFGDDVVDHYLHFFQAEIKSFQQSVTDWERQRYFEQI